MEGVLRRRYLVVVAGDAAQARQMTTGIRGVATLAAISDSAVREQGPADRVVQVASQRLLVVWPAFAPLDADGRARVVAHELTHAALAEPDVGPHAGLARRGDRALRLGRPPRRRRRALRRRRRGPRLAPRAHADRPLGAGRDRPARRRRPVRRLRLQLRGGLLHRRALRPQALPAPLRRLQRPGPDRARGRRADRGGRPAHARPLAARARARPAPLDRHARRGRPLRALSSNAHARAARGRDDPPQPGAPRGGAHAASGWRSSTRAGAARSPRASSPTRVEGRAGRAARPPRQVPDLGARGRGLPARAPADDRHPAARPRRARAQPRLVRARRPPAGVHGPAPLRHGRAGAGGGRAGRVPGGAARGRAARRRVHPRAPATGSRARRGRRSRRSCSIRSGSRASATSTPTRRSSARASTRCGPRTGSRARSARRCATRSSRRWRRGSRPRAPRSTTSATPTASAGPSRTSS